MDLARVHKVDDLVRRLSHEEDPDRIIRTFAGYDQHSVARDGVVTVSRRALQPPQYKITRSSLWKERINPWASPEKLPIFDRGILGELLYAGKPAIIDGVELRADDPAREYLEGVQSIACVPTYDRGEPLNMAMLLRRAGPCFTAGDLESILLNANLVSRAVNNALLAGQVREAYQKLDREMQRVGEMQRQLLPASLPIIEGLQLAARYVTCSRAGGDYYDVFRLDDRHWGLCIGDVSGHGTPAAVVMAMLHTLVHTLPAASQSPGAVLSHVNRHMTAMVPDGMFATAIYAVYDSHSQTLRYANAGHPIPRCRRGGQIVPLPHTPGLPLGVSDMETWPEQEFQLERDDMLVFFTDGLVEGMNPGGEQFGTHRLEQALHASPEDPAQVVEHLDRHHQAFCEETVPMDDRTLLVAVARGARERS
jgi:sigma-B regulation protein RsbU (phosphoserine phosphatase)